jgi:hypothetical protein
VIEKRQNFGSGSVLEAYVHHYEVPLGLHLYCIQLYEIVLQCMVFIEKLK